MICKYVFALQRNVHWIVSLFPLVLLQGGNKYLNFITKVTASHVTNHAGELYKNEEKKHIAMSIFTNSYHLTRIFRHAISENWLSCDRSLNKISVNCDTHITIVLFRRNKMSYRVLRKLYFNITLKPKTINPCY